jgi:DNA polymerase-4
MRKIIHIDMDAFFASVEERDNPALVGKPVVVGGAPDSRGVVATANYIARRFGIHSAMPASQAYRLCPFAQFIRPRFDAYREASAQIMEIFHRFSDVIEQLSIDEAYIDVSDTIICHGSATLIAKAIKRAIKDELHLTASAGVSYNKFLAKTASGMNKPDGLTVIKPEDGAKFVQKLKVGDFYGIGKATEAKMARLGIRTGADLARWSVGALVTQFGKAGYWYAQLAQGEDPRPVRVHRERKSIGHETTFARDQRDTAFMLAALDAMLDKVFAKLAEKNLQARTLTLKVKYANFDQITRSASYPEAISQESAKTALRELFAKTDAGERAVRLLGVSLSALEAVEKIEMGLL